MGRGKDLASLLMSRMGLESSKSGGMSRLVPLKMNLILACRSGVKLSVPAHGPHVLLDDDVKGMYCSSGSACNDCCLVMPTSSDAVRTV